MPRTPRQYHLQRTYGLTEEQYASILERQGGGCAICGKTEEQEGKKLAIDHDHTTGEIRGACCTFCNHRIIGRHRDPALLRRVADYIQGPHYGWFVPPKKRKKRKPRTRGLK